MDGKNDPFKPSSPKTLSFVATNQSEDASTADGLTKQKDAIAEVFTGFESDEAAPQQTEGVEEAV